MKQVTFSFGSVKSCAFSYYSPGVFLCEMVAFYFPVFFGELCVSGLKKDFLILVETLLLNDGSNHVIFLIYLLCFCWLMTVSLHGSFLLFSDSHKLCSYCVSDCWNNFLLEGRFDRRFYRDWYMFNNTRWVGGLCMYVLYFTVRFMMWCASEKGQFNVTSR